MYPGLPCTFLNHISSLLPLHFTGHIPCGEVLQQAQAVVHLANKPHQERFVSEDPCDDVYDVGGDDVEEDAVDAVQRLALLEHGVSSFHRWPETENIAASNQHNLIKTI